VKAIEAPCSAKAIAIALPIPREAPVIRATFPSSSFIFSDIELIVYCLKGFRF
jgi:hypothetical protein